MAPRGGFLQNYHLHCTTAAAVYASIENEQQRHCHRLHHYSVVVVLYNLVAQQVKPNKLYDDSPNELMETYNVFYVWRICQGVSHGYPKSQQDQSGWQGRQSQG